MVSVNMLPQQTWVLARFTTNFTRAGWAHKVVILYMILDSVPQAVFISTSFAKLDTSFFSNKLRDNFSPYLDGLVLLVHHLYIVS